jgi:hypothetical protein
MMTMTRAMVDVQYTVYVIRPSAVQAEKKNLGEARAWCPRGVVNRMKKAADLTSKCTNASGRHGDVTLDVQVEA